jgi:lipopolysaccharide/colanic/teichoic acid biosynthesis glycosyltransferase
VNIRLPSSRASLRLRLSPIDVALAAVSPFAALYLRNVDMASPNGMIITGTYFFVSLLASLFAFQAFRISTVIPHYISVVDVIRLAKAVLFAELMTATVLFAATRLNGIPRSVPAIHALILAAGLAVSRGLAVVGQRRRRLVDRPQHSATEHVILIGLNDLSVLILRYLQAFAPEQRRVIALLDEDPRWIGRHVNGVPVFGPPAQLEALIEEFAGHGVRTDRVVVGGAAGVLSEGATAEVRAVCARRDIGLAFVPNLLELDCIEPAGRSAERAANRLPNGHSPPEISPSPYSYSKRFIDVVAALILILWLMPLLILAAGIVFLDVGWPVLFWQLRTGQGGRELQIYKFRTLRALFNRRGQRIPEEQRISWIGRLLRRIRIDELPQLLNVLAGDMSLIGPRPLLARDQPPNSAVRLVVRPGITGWAQVNGGTSLSPTEKEALDIWYIRNASMWVDLRIIGMTVLLLLRGERRSEKALAQAQWLQGEQFGRSGGGLKQPASAPFAIAVARPRRDDAGQTAPMRSR